MKGRRNRTLVNGHYESDIHSIFLNCQKFYQPVGEGGETNFFVFSEDLFFSFDASLFELDLVFLEDEGLV